MIETDAKLLDQRDFGYGFLNYDATFEKHVIYVNPKPAKGSAELKNNSKYLQCNVQ